MKVKSDVATATLTHRAKISRFWQRRRFTKYWRYALSSACIGLASIATGLNLGIVHRWEYQTQSLFFELRGPVAAPEDIVILAIDDESLSQGQHYLSRPERYPDLAGIGTWPWQRSVYATVINRLVEAGAKAVVLDIVFSTPSSYGPADDEALLQALQEHGEQIVLAAEYGGIDLRQGELLQPTLPLPKFTETPVKVGAINFFEEPDGGIHRLGHEFLDYIKQMEVALTGSAASFDEGLVPSFAEATLQAAEVPFSLDSGNHIFFYGPPGTFTHIPFWYALDLDPWVSQLQSGAALKDKIVLIGGTAQLLQDFHQTPFSESLLYPDSIAGVEVLANTIATLQEDRALRSLIRQAWLNAAIVLILGLAAASLMHRIPRQKPLRRLLLGASVALLWMALSYGLFVSQRLILITAMPALTVLGITAVDFTSGFFSERLRKKTLRNTLARYVTSPIVQEIISQQDDFQDLLTVRENAITGAILSDRYRILKVLGSGGFGETYLAEDTQRPGNPTCVVKQLKIISDNPRTHRLAQRLFASEAATLEKLGEHDQIPRLLAYFEYNYAFYLVQEMVEGQLLRDLLADHQPMSQRSVVDMLLSLLPVVQMVHERGVIHRDIKPSNIIQRDKDGQYVLIDFGAVKQISNRLTDTSARITSTVGIGTQGYMPSEQSAGLPNFSSDLYALGVTAIEALTGLPPHALQRSQNGEILWTHKIKDLVPRLAAVINRM
ncbi:MAG: CHASE2 domain-containing protein, partial [Leptolyngbya sp. SIO4C1]|nr:CHASE2 domain-containing protein [Leptolyngbya sp. SIO4C1]